jgi:chromosome segregation ATPase
MTDRQTEIVNRLRSLDAKMTVLDDQMQWVIAALGRVLTRERTVMTSITELQAKADATLARVQNETNTVNAVKAVVEHSNDMIAALRQQLTDAIAAGVDPAALQKLSESTDMANAQVVADAVVAGTPADPAAGGSTGGVGGTEPTGGVDEGTSAAGSDAKVTGGDGAKT